MVFLFGVLGASFGPLFLNGTPTFLRTAVLTVANLYLRPPASFNCQIRQDKLFSKEVNRFHNCFVSNI